MDSKLENNSNRPILDIDTLLEVGLNRIGQLSGSIWTDHSPSDPGITMLEVLSFAIMDLGYRMTFDIRDLLTVEGEMNPRYKNVFHEPYKVLSSAPVTINDYRKLILENIEGVRNVWLKANEKPTNIPKEILSINNKSVPGSVETKVKGFYDVYLDCIDYKEDSSIINQVKTLLHKNRQLCEDINKCEALKPLNVGIEADIEVKQDYDYEVIRTKIYSELSKYVSPDLRFYTLEEMLDKGKSVSDIFTGPFPGNGYVDMDEVEDFESVKILYVSDIISLIMKIEGVIGVRHLKFFVNDATNRQKVIIDKHKIEIKTEFEDKNVFRFDKDAGRILFLLNGYRIALDNSKRDEVQSKVINHELKYTFDKDNSSNRSLDTYYSIQSNFPEIFLVGRENIAEDETDLRKAQRMQLKAYLAFFDQLLANFLMRLNSAKQILSWEKQENIDEWREKQKNSLVKILNNEAIEDIEKVLNQKAYSDYLYEEVFNEDKELDQKNRVLNHLLARFNEDFVNFSVLQYIMQNKNNVSNESKYSLIYNKSLMLEKLPTIAYKRANGIDYTSEIYINETQNDNELWFNDGNYYALEQKLYIKLGLKPYSPLKKLHPIIKKRAEENGGVTVFEDNSGVNYTETFGLHIYEHNLLLPTEVTKDNFLYQYKNESRIEYLEDPYSMKVTVVLPGWLDVVQNHQFRDIVENVITEEFPAHIAIKICWIDPLQMLNIEEHYDRFILSLKEKEKNDAALSAFASSLSRLNNIFRETKLGEKAILGQTTLTTERYIMEKQ